MMLNLMVIRGDGARSQAKLSAGVEVECFLVVKDVQDDSFDVIKSKLGDFQSFWVEENSETLQPACGIDVASGIIANMDNGRKLMGW